MVSGHTKPGGLRNSLERSAKEWSTGTRGAWASTLGLIGRHCSAPAFARNLTFGDEEALFDHAHAQTPAHSSQLGPQRSDR
jgi:hypothetical protein